MKAIRIKATSPDKVDGKYVKYRKGDCLSIHCEGMYLAVLISDKFNKYYDFTLIEYYKNHKPAMSDFENGRFFGTRFGSWEDLLYAVDKLMIECKIVDIDNDIECIGKIDIIPSLRRAGYSYILTNKELLERYLEELPIRIQKTANAEKFPEIAFASKHLVEVKHIIKM